MEHEVNRLIREKVEMAEGQPAAWHKDRVWQVIRAEKRAPLSHKTTYYYVAASVVIAISAILSGIQYNYQTKTAAQIAALESMIDQRRDAVSSGSLHNETAATCPEDHALPVSQKAVGNVRPKVHQHGINYPSEAVAEEKKDQPENELALTPLTEANQGLESPEKTTSPPVQVQAIIGFIPTPQEVVYSPKVKKSRLRLFRNHNTEYNTLPLDETTLLTARIN